MNFMRIDRLNHSYSRISLAGTLRKPKGAFILFTLENGISAKRNKESQGKCTVT